MPVWIENLLWISEAITIPVVIVVLVPCFVWLFYKEIKGLIERSLLKVPGLDPADVPNQDNPPALPDPDGAEQRQERENPQNRELAAALAVSRVETAFERVYRVIYGSQMKALKELNTSPTGLAQDALSKHIPLAVILANVATFDQWFEYLKRTGLVVVREQNVVISEIGKQFLLYVTRQGYPELGPNTQW